MYGQVKTTLMQEIFAMTLCLWIKAGAGQTLGTPFSYSAPGQANELVLIEWGDNPMELLIDDKVREKTSTQFLQIFLYFFFCSLIKVVRNGPDSVRKLCFVNAPGFV